MNTKQSVLISLIFAVFISCKNKIEEAVDKMESIEEEVKFNIRQGSMGFTTFCYEYINAQDTIILKLDSPDYDRITGSLTYKFNDQNNFSGALQGRVVGDTIFADYFTAINGKQSIQEVAFLNKGDYYIQGHAPMDSIPGKMVFIKEAPLRFDQTVKLMAVPCTN